MEDFRSLVVWQKAHACTLAIYRATESFPSSERFVLVDQLRRAAVSVPSNIAEGCGRRTDADTLRFFQIAMGSASEAEYQLLLSRDLDYLDDQTYRTLNKAIIEVKKMMGALLRHRRKRMP